MDVLIKRNTVIPTKTTKDYTTVQDNQRYIDITIYEGERSKASRNHLLGEFKLQLIPAKRGVPHIKLTFEIDANGILKVTGVDTGTGKKKVITVSKGSGRLSEAEIEKMTQEAEKFADEDKKFRENTEAKQKLENYLYTTTQSISDDSVKSKLGEDAESIAATLKEAQTWLEANAEKEAEDYTAKYKEVEGACQPILSKVHGEGGGSGGSGSFDDSEDDNEDL